MRMILVASLRCLTRLSFVQSTAIRPRVFLRSSAATTSDLANQQCECKAKSVRRFLVWFGSDLIGMPTARRQTQRHAVDYLRPHADDNTVDTADGRGAPLGALALFDLLGAREGTRPQATRPQDNKTLPWSLHGSSPHRAKRRFHFVA